MFGPGKYDDLCTEARAKSNASGAILILFEGNKGTGFSCQAPLDILIKLPAVLRTLADQIENDANQTHRLN